MLESRNSRRRAPSRRDGIKGTGFGQVGAPNGIAVDPAGNIYVADATRHRVEKLAPDGNVIDEWKGPAPGFYGPRASPSLPTAHLCG